MIIQNIKFFGIVDTPNWLKKIVNKKYLKYYLIKQNLEFQSNKDKG